MVMRVARCSEDSLFWKELPFREMDMSHRGIGTNQIAMNSRLV